MIQKMKRALWMLVCLMAMVSANAVTIDGLDYILSGESASVSGVSDMSYRNEASKVALTIPSTITYNGKEYIVVSIGQSAFYGCGGLASITIPNSVTSIGFKAFGGCSGLTSVIIEDSEKLLSFGTSSYGYSQTFESCPLERVYLGRNISYYNSYSPFKGHSAINSLTIGDSVTSIGQYAFSDCSGLTSVNIPDSVTSIGDGAFYRCGGLTSVTIGSSVTTIGERAFYGCSGLTSVTLPDNIASVKYLAFPDINIYVNARTLSLVTLWRNGYIPYQVGTHEQLLPPTIEIKKTTATSITAKGHYEEGSVNVVGQDIYCLYWYYDENIIKKQEGDSIFVKGLNPSLLNGLPSYFYYGVGYTLEVDYGGTETATCGAFHEFSLEPLKIATAQPKVVSIGNVIVSATTNIDENEENVGFEWRCIDWTEEFASNTGTAVLYDGKIEGYIKNLNTDKLWKFRPYYLSDDGTYHYGDWMGMDPTNTSYFEPTVHTYSTISIEGNMALVKGYALGGTDDVVVKGFKYWKTGGAAQTKSASFPADAITVEATGQQKMSAHLIGLAYNSTYHYVAFATTSAGETFYGEEQMFRTPLATAQYATFYDSQSSYTLPAGLTASVVTGMSSGKLVYKVIAEGGKSNNVVPKGVAVMLTSAQEDASAYTLTPTESDVTYTGTNWLHGSDEATTTTASGNCRFYKLSYGPSGTDKSEVFGWYWGAANGGAFSIAGHKAWLAVPMVAGAPTRSFSMEGDATDIVDIETTKMQNEDEGYYDLQGRRVTEPVSRGIYIHKGKKIIIR